MISKPCPSAGRWGLAMTGLAMTGLAITGLACAALSITSLEPASAAPAASVAQAEGPPPATNTGSQRSVGVATMPDRPPRAPEPADTSSGLLYRTSRIRGRLHRPLHRPPEDLIGRQQDELLPVPQHRLLVGSSHRHAAHR